MPKTPWNDHPTTYNKGGKTMICPNCGTSSQGKFCPQCGTELRNQPSGAENKPTGVYFSENVKAAARSDVPMTWHKWLIYGLLWLWALSSLANGTLLFEAGAFFDGLLFFALAAGCVYVRFQLARLKTARPRSCSSFPLSSMC